MPRSLILLLLVPTFMISCKGKNDPFFPTITEDTNYKKTFLDSTQDLVRNGNYKEALKRFIWYDRHILEQDTNMRGVKNSFALSYWLDLAKDYPAAMDSFKRIRAEKLDLLLREGKSADLFADVVAMDRELDEEYKTIPLFRTITTRYPELATNCWRYCIDDLLEAREYNLLKKTLSSPMTAYNRFEKIQKTVLEEMQSDEEKQDFIKDAKKEVLEMSKESFRKQCRQLIKYCEAINDEVSAQTIRERYKEFTGNAL